MNLKTSALCLAAAGLAWPLSQIGRSAFASLAPKSSSANSPTTSNSVGVALASTQRQFRSRSTASTTTSTTLVKTVAIDESGANASTLVSQDLDTSLTTNTPIFIDDFASGFVPSGQADFAETTQALGQHSISFVASDFGGFDIDSIAPGQIAHALFFSAAGDPRQRLNVSIAVNGRSVVSETITTTKHPLSKDFTTYAIRIPGEIRAKQELKLTFKSENTGNQPKIYIDNIYLALNTTDTVPSPVAPITPLTPTTSPITTVAPLVPTSTRLQGPATSIPSTHSAPITTLVEEVSLDNSDSEIS